MDQIKEATIMPKEATMIEGDFINTKLLVFDSDCWNATKKKKTTIQRKKRIKRR